ncbi:MULTISPECIES: hypothetical protein [unclassified Aureimonas]|uniref:hypothetical protein n=1 Tax=unclassified Aureimonas TaxID=2615206 RepID=UPI0006F4EC6C|nr:MULTISPECIES: hypothetical protein [unclassified Aureimonas]KQT52209.1 hypothetical protein ASG62_16255 [Aureimonas sp. Leaf427]KQT70557.1 hypothetical protein ASG54_21695 [Aureimonas sp. Leaf460]
MNDEQFRELKQILLDQNCRLSDLANHVRRLQVQMDDLQAGLRINDIAHIGGMKELDTFMSLLGKGPRPSHTLPLPQSKRSPSK